MPTPASIAHVSDRLSSGGNLIGALEAPEIIDQLTLYTRGDQRMIAELMPSKMSLKEGGAVVRKRIAAALGTWLYDSVIRFPGVILSRIAAASFLGVDATALELPAVKSVFASAQYNGPFAELDSPLWWRHRLSDLLNEADVSDGRALVKKRLGKQIKPCLCAVDGKSPAGFVCVIDNVPVCEAHSVGQVSWLPRGADLARVQRPHFDELGPWIGMS